MPKTEHPLALESARTIEHEKDMDRLAMAIDAQLSYARERKIRRSLEWFRNAAFLAGNHLDTFRYAQGTFTQDAVVIPDRFKDVMSPTMVDNHILRIAQANLAELTGMDPYPEVTQASLDPDDEDLSKLAEIVLRLLWEKPLRMPQKLRIFIGYLEITGLAAIETHFSDLSTVEERPKLKEVELPDVTTGELVKQTVESDELEWVQRQGLVTRVWSGFHVDVNPDATDDPDSITWVCRSTFEDVETMRRMFDRKETGYHPENLPGIGASGGEYSDDPLWKWEQIKDLIDSPEGVPFGLDRGARRSMANCVRVRVIDTRPNLDFPTGRTIVQVGGKVVYAGGSRVWTEEYPERWTPMRIGRWWTLPGRFEGIPLISTLVPLQKRINALDTIIRLNRQHMGIGAWMLPKACGIPEGFIGPFPGQNIPYRAGSRGEKPERVPFQALTADIFEERASCVASMERLGGIASAQLQSSPSALRAGVMLDFSQRQAMQSKSAIVLDFETFVGDLCQDILQEVARNLATDADLLRRVRVAARELGDVAVERYTSLDLRDNVRVRIDLRSQLLQTPEAKKESATQFMQYAGPNMTPAERAKLAKIMGLDEIESTVTPQWKRVTRMVERILQGQVEAGVPLKGVDDPGLFAEVIRNAMCTERATTAPLEVKSKLQELLDIYSAELAERAAAAQVALANAGPNAQTGA